MGFLQLIPAGELKALYVPVLPDSGKLVLSARGEAQKFTSGIAFHAEQGTPGELHFALMGWVGPLAPGKTPYERTQAFAELRFPGTSVLVQTANHPHGIHVPVTVAPSGLAPGGAQGTTPDPSLTAANQPQAADSVTVMQNFTFDLANPSAVNFGGAVTMEYDSTMLALQNAGIRAPTAKAEIAWTFKGIKIGETQVKISTRGGIAEFAVERIVSVKITPESAAG
jgi:hypothetical protein